MARKRFKFTCRLDKIRNFRWLRGKRYRNETVETSGFQTYFAMKKNWDKMRQMYYFIEEITQSRIWKSPAELWMNKLAFSFWFIPCKVCLSLNPSHNEPKLLNNTMYIWSLNTPEIRVTWYLTTLPRNIDIRTRMSFYFRYLRYTKLWIAFRLRPEAIQLIGFC